MARSKSKRSKIPSKKASDQDAPSLTVRPGGKLGLIVDRLATSSGATADELSELTGWQTHSVLGALSRLRARGFATRLETEGARKVYRLSRQEG